VSLGCRRYKSLPRPGAVLDTWLLWGADASDSILRRIRLCPCRRKSRWRIGKVLPAVQCGPDILNLTASMR
jgi:hypothetical protein